MIIFFIICSDLIYQSITHENLFGFKAVPQGNIYRLGGFMDDELKISNLIYHFGTLVFAYNFYKKTFLLKIFKKLIFFKSTIPKGYHYHFLKHPLHALR